jgi:hypothetical protein
MNLESNNYLILFAHPIEIHNKITPGIITIPETVASIHFDGQWKIDKCNFSGCIPSDSIEIIKTVFKKGVKYLIGPGYINSPKAKIKSDFQMCVTGKLKNGETVRQAAQREISEEIGIWSKTSNLEFIGNTIDHNGIRTANMLLNISECKQNRYNEPKKIGKDIPNRKIAVWIYAKDIEDLDLLTKITNKNKIKSKDKTSFISVVSIEQALVMSEWISKNRKKIRFDTYTMNEIIYCKNGTNCKRKFCRFVHK